MDKYQFVDKIKEIFNITVPISIYQEFDLNNLYEVVFAEGIAAGQVDNLAIDCLKDRIATASMCLDDAMKQLGGR